MAGATEELAVGELGAGTLEGTRGRRVELRGQPEKRRSASPSSSWRSAWQCRGHGARPGDPLGLRPALEESERTCGRSPAHRHGSTPRFGRAPPQKTTRELRDLASASERFVGAAEPELEQNQRPLCRSRRRRRARGWRRAPRLSAASCRHSSSSPRSAASRASRTSAWRGEVLRRFPVASAEGLARVGRRRNPSARPRSPSSSGWGRICVSAPSAPASRATRPARSTVGPVRRLVVTEEESSPAREEQPQRLR